MWGRDITGNFKEKIVNLKRTINCTKGYRGDDAAQRYPCSRRFSAVGGLLEIKIKETMAQGRRQ